MLIPVVRRAPGARTVRALAVVLAVVLALFQVAAAGHRHDRRAGGPVDGHACTLCAVLSAELPAPSGLPPPIVKRAARSYPVARDDAGACPHGRPPIKPAGCGPPAPA